MPAIHTFGNNEGQKGTVGRLEEHKRQQKRTRNGNKINNKTSTEGTIWHLEEGVIWQTDCPDASWRLIHRNLGEENLRAVGTYKAKLKHKLEWITLLQKQTKRGNTW